MVKNNFSTKQVWTIVGIAFIVAIVVAVVVSYLGIME